MTEQFIHHDLAFMCEQMCQTVPEPLWPDPDKEPLPEPVINQIQRKPPTRVERSKITMFSIWTPIPEDQIPEPTEEEKAQAEDEADGVVKEKLPPLTDKHTRWILQPGETKQLYIKFFSTKINLSPYEQ